MTSSASPKMDGAGLAETALTEFGRWRPYLVPGLPMDMLKLISFGRSLIGGVLTRPIPWPKQCEVLKKKRKILGPGQEGRERKCLDFERQGEKKKVEKDRVILLCYIVLHDAQCAM